MTAAPQEAGGGAATRPLSASSPADLMAPALRRRMACWLYEGMLLFGLVFTAGLVFSIAGQMRNAMDSRQPLFQAFLFVVCGIYFTWCWSRGQTLAMRTWRIRMVDRAGQPVGQLRAFFRYLCSWLWFLPPLAALQAGHLSAKQAAIAILAWVVFWAALSRWHPQRQFLHDALAGTRLVEAPPPAARA
ncbi:RDD family protein [uncultured Ramlibacter sp.]|uniref:RDD family protein n=1 Tax=uncultured Ramlibacter sp. TaxID=260755 RepID=UPI002622D1D6|nr:RDD family protein [uncultured Ramlibacter sp.]